MDKVKKAVLEALDGYLPKFTYHNEGGTIFYPEEDVQAFFNELGRMNTDAILNARARKQRVVQFGKISHGLPRERRASDRRAGVKDKKAGGG